jgi:hypothetical protein
VKVRLAVTAFLLLALLAAAGVQAAGNRRLAAYAGTGTWVSIYDHAAWANPEAVIEQLRQQHIHTLYLQTSNARQPTAIRHPAGVSRFLDAAHNSGIRVVGWYLPSFTNNRRDLARIVAGARFESATGSRFHSFAVDVEATDVRHVPLRTRRAVQLVAAVRKSLPQPYVLGVITPDPVGSRYWANYPFRELAGDADVFLPMAYFTARTRGARNVERYSRANIAAVRRLAGNPNFPVHPIGGETRRATLPELRAFLDASAGTGTVGVSFWEYGQTTPAQWALLARR